ncbi:MAG: helix-turn-helix domain-containing protein [Melioribacteraceae bacterium]
MNELLKNFGDELKSLREEKGISLQQVYNKIRIDIKFLTAIENGNFEILPEIYIRAFIKEYAQYLNLEVNETIKKYELAKKGVESKNEIISDEPSSEIPIETPKIIEPQKVFNDQFPNSLTNMITFGSLKVERKKFLSILAIAILFIAAGSIAIYLLVDSGPETITTGNENSINSLNESRYEEIAKPIKPTAAESKSFQLDSLTLAISATNATWIKVSSDKREMFRDVLTPDNPIEIKADTLFEISVQFPAVIIAKLNGKNLGVLASGNELWHLKIDSTGVFRSFKIVNTKNDTGN